MPSLRAGTRFRVELERELFKRNVWWTQALEVRPEIVSCSHWLLTRHFFSGKKSTTVDDAGQ